MHREAWLACIRKGKLSRKRDWLADMQGLLIVAGLWPAFTHLLFEKNGWLDSSLIWLCLAVSLPAYAIYCLSRENDLTAVTTNSDLRGNRKLVVAAFRALGWQVHTNTKYVVTAGANNERWWRGAGQTATAILADNQVYLHVTHGGNARRGRLPFYFGSNRRKLKRAIATIQKINSLPVAWLR